MYIHVQATPNARKESIEKAGTNAYGHAVYRIRTSAVAADNEANAAIQKMLGKELGIPYKHIILKSGHTSRQKLFYIDTPSAGN